MCAADAVPSEQSRRGRSAWRNQKRSFSTSLLLRSLHEKSEFELHFLSYRPIESTSSGTSYDVIMAEKRLMNAGKMWVYTAERRKMTPRCVVRMSVVMSAQSGHGDDVDGDVSGDVPTAGP